MNDIKKKLARMEQLKQQIRDSQEALDQIVLTLATLYEDYHDH